MNHMITLGTMSISDLDVPGYERVQLADDPVSGLRAIIAVHDTRLGPALGGTRFRHYATDGDALHDVLRLSKGMTSKAAAAGLGLGGGKAVIIGSPQTPKTPQLLRAYGTFVDSFGGGYITAADIGTTADDLDVIGEVTDHVVGRTAGRGGLGDSGYSTALGVFVSMQSAVGHVRGTSLEGLRVGVEGAGKVGRRLIGMLLDAGANVVVHEASENVRKRIQSEYPSVTFSDDLFHEDLDVYAPCALGATLTEQTVIRLTAPIVCGAANNQLDEDAVGDLLVAHGITWVPDYVANAGGLIQVDAERRGETLESARLQVRALADRVSEVLARAVADRVSPGIAADRLVSDRLDAAARGTR